MFGRKDFNTSMHQAQRERQKHAPVTLIRYNLELSYTGSQLATIDILLAKISAKIRTGGITTVEQIMFRVVTKNSYHFVWNTVEFVEKRFDPGY